MGSSMIRERSYPTEATSGVRQAHHQVCAVRGVIGRFMWPERYAWPGDPSRAPLGRGTGHPATRFIAAMTCSTSGGLTGG
jgi:hypothetical protein